MKWYLKPWKEYGDFSGRARRKEYWTFTLINLLIILPLVSYVEFKGTGDNISILISLVLMVFILATLVPTLAVTTRRYHDTNHSGWYNQFAGILSMKWLCQDSDIGENDFGPDPKAGEHNDYWY